MINDKKYKEVLDSGLILDHYHVLCSIRDGTSLLENRRVQGFINLLTKKGYLDDMKLTEKGSKFIGEVEEKIITPSEPVVEVAAPKVELLKPPTNKLGDWVADLHTHCQDKLMELTGKKQQIGRVDKADKGYPFLPNVVDLGRVITACVNSYKLKDLPKVEKTIMSYIGKCSKTNKWLPILRYYILKNGMSQMVTDMENDDTDEPDYKSSQKFV